MGNFSLNKDSDAQRENQKPPSVNPVIDSKDFVSWNKSFLRFSIVFVACLLFLHLLRNLGVVLLEALADALLGGHPLEDAAVEAAGFLGGEGL